MRLIGKGAFSRVYMSDEIDKNVIILTNDPAKECLSMNWHDNESGVFPTLERVDCNDDCHVYTQKYYPRVRSLKNNLKPDQWELYKELRNLSSNTNYCENKYNRYQNLYEAFENADIEETVKYDLLSMLDALSNFGPDIVFEISPRNVTVDNGKLILIDCFFFVSALDEVLKKKRKL